MPDSPDTCGRKPYPERKVARSEIFGYVSTGPCKARNRLKYDSNSALFVKTAKFYYGNNISL